MKRTPGGTDVPAWHTKRNTPLRRGGILKLSPITKRGKIETFSYYEEGE